MLYLNFDNLSIDFIIFTFCLYLVVFFVGYIFRAIHFFIPKIKAEFIVTPNGIEIKTKDNSFFINRNNISNIYVSKINNLSPRTRDGYECAFCYYKLIFILRESIKLSNGYIYKNQFEFDLFSAIGLYYEDSVAFILQQFIKVLNLNLNLLLMGDEIYPTIKTNNSRFESQEFTSDFNYDLEEPKNVDFVNLEVIKNVDSELIVNKKVQHSGIISFLFVINILLILALHTTLYADVLSQLNQFSLLLSYIILGGLSIGNIVSIILFFITGKGFSISINSYNIEQKTIFPLGINFVKPYSIKIKKDVRAKIYETIVSKYNPEETSFGVVLKSKSNEFPVILLISGISLEESKYIIGKINNFVSKNN